MDQRPAFEGQKRLAVRGTVFAVLLLRRLVGRSSQGVFQLQRGDGDAVDEKHDIDGVLVAQRIPDLRHDCEDVGLIGALGRRIEPRGGLEGAKGDLDAGNDSDALTEHFEGADCL